MANVLTRMLRRYAGANPFDVTICIGAPRSGTTLIASLISEGSSCAPMLPESTYLTQLMRHYYDLVHYADAQRFAVYAVSPERALRIYRRAVTSMSVIAAHHFDWWRYENIIFKDPELTNLLDLVPSFFAHCENVVYVVRDPADVVASMYKVYKDSERETDARNISDDIYQYFWAAHGSDLFKSGKVHVVRFEKILNKDEAEFQRLEAYLGFSIGRQGFAKVQFQPDTDDATYSENFGKPISGKLPSKAQRYLNVDDLSYIRESFSGFNETYEWW